MKRDLIMGLFDLFKKKAKPSQTHKCTQCLRTIEGQVWSIENENYCHECYLKKMTIIQQNAYQEKETKQKINSFVCEICKKEFPVKYLHSNNICANCANTKINGTINSTLKAKNASTNEFLDDITFIGNLNHATVGSWHQYDVLLAARGYGWDMMKEWADYMAKADLENISQITVASIGLGETDITASYTSHGGEIGRTPELDVERGILSIAGISKTLEAPIKLVWINQTQILRFFTVFDDELLIKKYAETVVRRTFGTQDAMKMGKPIPQRSENEFFMLIKDVFFVKGKGVVINGFVQSGQISVNESIVVKGKSFKVRGIKIDKGLAAKVSADSGEVSLLLDEVTSSEYFKAGDVVTAERS